MTLDTGSQFSDIVRGTPSGIDREARRDSNSPTFCAVCGSGWRENRDNWDWVRQADQLRLDGERRLTQHRHRLSTTTRKRGRTTTGNRAASFRVQATSAIIDGGKIYPVFNSNNSTYIEHLPLVAESVGNDIRTIPRSSTMPGATTGTCRSTWGSATTRIDRRINRLPSSETPNGAHGSGGAGISR
jgi:hypothetical protein